MYRKWKLNYQDFVEFYLNLNITQHNMHWKLSITHESIPTLITQSSIGDVLQTQPFNLSWYSEMKLWN